MKPIFLSLQKEVAFSEIEKAIRDTDEDNFFKTKISKNSSSFILGVKGVNGKNFIVAPAEKGNYVRLSFDEGESYKDLKIFHFISERDPEFTPEEIESFILQKARELEKILQNNETSSQ
jgi:hypothetical protein